MPVGMIFELPIVVMFLSKAGLITPELMKTYRKHSSSRAAWHQAGRKQVTYASMMILAALGAGGCAAQQCGYCLRHAVCGDDG